MKPDFNTVTTVSLCEQDMCCLQMFFCAEMCQLEHA